MRSVLVLANPSRTRPYTTLKANPRSCIRVSVHPPGLFAISPSARRRLSWDCNEIGCMAPTSTHDPTCRNPPGEGGGLDRADQIDCRGWAGAIVRSTYGNATVDQRCGFRLSV